jgi:hypothetical protein
MTMFRAALLSTSSGWALIATESVTFKPGTDASIRFWCGMMKGRFV